MGNAGWSAIELSLPFMWSVGGGLPRYRTRFGACAHTIVVAFGLPSSFKNLLPHISVKESLSLKKLTIFRPHYTQKIIFYPGGARPTANSRTGLVSKPCALKRYCCPYRGVGKGKCDHYQHETKHRYRHYNFVAPSHFAG